jgi:uncharacterized protein YhbP (UPF0306 family)
MGLSMGKLEKQREMVAALLRGQTTLSLATTGSDGEACVAPLFYIADEELTLYWLSAKSSAHSINLTRTPRAAAAVYRDTADWKKICGVQVQGTTSMIVEPERRRALVAAYCERFKLGSIFRVAIRRSALYAFQPEVLRYIDNAKRFGYKFELRRGDFTGKRGAAIG